MRQLIEMVIELCFHLLNNSCVYWFPHQFIIKLGHTRNVNWLVGFCPIFRPIIIIYRRLFFCKRLLFFLLGVGMDGLCTALLGMGEHVLCTLSIAMDSLANVFTSYGAQYTHQAHSMKCAMYTKHRMVKKLRSVNVKRKMECKATWKAHKKHPVPIYSCWNPKQWSVQIVLLSV